MSTSHHDLLASREKGREGEERRGRKKMDDEDFEFVKTLMVTLTTLSCDPGITKVSVCVWCVRYVYVLV